ncbi:MAG: pentapeptide repeat-containing protein [Cyanobium sp.]
MPVSPCSPGRCRRLRISHRLLSLLLPVCLLLAVPVPVGAEFSGVDYTLTNQNEQDFSGQDLAHTSFAGAQGRHSSFRGADLHGAILTQAAFPDADFTGADLSDVLMDKVDFSGADFSGAVLQGVIASGSSFRGATVTDADFSDALLDREDIRSLCREASGTNPVTGVETRLSLGCG